MTSFLTAEPQFANQAASPVLAGGAQKVTKPHPRLFRRLITQNKPFQSDGILMNYKFVQKLAQKTKEQAGKCITFPEGKGTEKDLKKMNVLTKFTDAFKEVYTFYERNGGNLSKEIFTLADEESYDDFYDAVKFEYLTKKLQMDLLSVSNASLIPSKISFIKGCRQNAIKKICNFMSQRAPLVHNGNAIGRVALPPLLNRDYKAETKN